MLEQALRRVLADVVRDVVREILRDVVREELAPLLGAAPAAAGRACGTDDLIGTTEAAAVLGVTPETIRRWVDSGVLPGFRAGRLLRVRRRDLLRPSSARPAGGGEAPIDPDAIADRILGRGGGST